MTDSSTAAHPRTTALVMGPAWLTAATLLLLSASVPLDTLAQLAVTLVTMVCALAVVSMLASLKRPRSWVLVALTAALSTICIGAGLYWFWPDHRVVVVSSAAVSCALSLAMAVRYALRLDSTVARVLHIVLALALVSACALMIQQVVTVYDYTEAAPTSAPPPDEREDPAGPIQYRSMAVGSMVGAWVIAGGVYLLSRRSLKASQAVSTV